MSMEPSDRRQIEGLLSKVRGEWQGAHAIRGVPGGGMVVLSNGLQVTIGLEAGSHAGAGGAGDLRLWLGVSRSDRLPTFAEIQALIALVFSASQCGAANPLSISTAGHLPNLVLCSSRLRHDPRAA